MSGLKRRIVSLVEAAGPLSVHDYMALCLYDPAAGYYTNRDPFGRAGDFTTAPEISQMFGELVAAWLYAEWDGAGRPLPATVAEIGPGRGTLMKDMLRTFARLDPAFAAAAGFAMVETSDRLAGIQRASLAGGPALPAWHKSVATLPGLPLFIVGNELFDAIPVRQYVKAAAGWRERVVTVDGGGELGFAAGIGALDPDFLPPDAENAPIGAVVEVSPGRAALMDEIAARIATHGGAGLFVDYGYLEPAVGDTLQALRAHRYEDALASPGEADLTTHVDFSALAEAARAHGLDVRLSTQGEFLVGLGLLERAGRLGANAGEAARERISSEVERLAAPRAMGELFKVMEIRR